MNQMGERRYKERRKCRKFTPIIFMSLELFGILEGLFIGYAIFGDNIAYKVIAILIFVVLAIRSYARTKAVYERSCKKPKGLDQSDRRKTFIDTGRI